MIYDKQKSVTILSSGLENGTRTSATWAWKDSEWTELSLSSYPPVRNTPNLAYDEQTQSVLMYAGQEGWSSGGIYHYDTWILE